MNQLKLITTKEQYEVALGLLSQLMDKSPEPGSAKSDKLDVLSVLIEKYESSNFHIDSPDPIEAIKFHMDRMGLTNKDMEPYFGSKARVSEVLNRKRPLSLSMMRSLQSKLGISAETLMRESNYESLDEIPGWEGLPIKEMFKKAYFPGIRAFNEVLDNEEQIVTAFLNTVSEPKVMQALLKSSVTQAHSRSARTMNKRALLAWCTRVFQKVESQPISTKYDSSNINEDFIRGLIELSPNPSGPKVAVEYLNRFGIHLIVEPHLSKTYLDGAAFMSDSGHPVIAMTLRFNRIDNFWFVLLHELAHVKLHLNGGQNLFFDDLETLPNSDDVENEADLKAGNWLIPENEWNNSQVRTTRDAQSAIALAKTLKIHPAIVVGRLQRNENNYRLLSKSIGRGQDQVRKLFEEF